MWSNIYCHMYFLLVVHKQNITFKIYATQVNIYKISKTENEFNCHKFVWMNLPQHYCIWTYSGVEFMHKYISDVKSVKQIFTNLLELLRVLLPWPELFLGHLWTSQGFLVQFLYLQCRDGNQPIRKIDYWLRSIFTTNIFLTNVLVFNIIQALY